MTMQDFPKHCTLKNDVYSLGAVPVGHFWYEKRPRPGEERAELRWNWISRIWRFTKLFLRRRRARSRSRTSELGLASRQPYQRMGVAFGIFLRLCVQADDTEGRSL